MQSTSLCPTSQPTSNNGNIVAVLNALNPSRSQGYGYDSLNRINSFSNGNESMTQTYQIDSFGNMNVNSGTLQSNLTFDAKNRIDVNLNPGYAYDAAGNLTQAPLAISGTQQYNYDGLSQLVSMGNPASPSASYTYDASGSRVRKDTASGWTEYVDFGGLPIAENNSATGWSDYIFAGGKRIARVDSTQTVDVRFTNDSCSGCGGTPVGGGDRNLYINSVTVGSTVIPPNAPLVTFTNVPCNFDQGYTGILDCNGDMVVSNVASGSPITVSAYGSSDYSIFPHMQVYLNGTLAGEWDTTGSSQSYTVYPIHYYSADHLGTTTVTTNGQGALENDSDYYPFGAEIPVTAGAPNHYKFTGKERDAESGNDYFGARYYNTQQVGSSARTGTPRAATQCRTQSWTTRRV